MNGLPSRNRFAENHYNTEKYRVCQERLTSTNPDTRNWLTTTGRASHDLSKYAVFYAILDKEKDVVVKVGPDVLKTEYAIGKQLESLGLPTFIQYYCLFDCLDDKETLFDKKKMPEYFCKQNSSYRMHALVMPTIKGEIIEKIKWNRKSFPIFKNVLKHIVMSMFCAMSKFGFVHGDLHTGNILLVKMQNQMILNYNMFGALDVQDYIPVIMDYDMSKVNITDSKSQSFMYKDLRRYIYNACAEMQNMRIDDVEITRLLGQLTMDCEPPTPTVCKQICDTIDKMDIKFIMSELQRPFGGGAKTRRAKSK